MADFTMFAGDSKLMPVTVVDEDGVAVNITGATITWKAARTVNDTAVISKTVGSGIALTSPLTGVFTITLDAADTDDLEGLYYHEAEMVLSGDTSTVLTGNMIVEQTLIRGAVMTAASNIADLDAALDRTGETVTVKHWTTTMGTPRPSVSASVKASVRAVKADELAAGIDQTWSKVVLSPTGLAALLPLAKGDKITVQGRERHVELPKPILVDDTVVRIDVMVSG